MKGKVSKKGGARKLLIENSNAIELGKMIGTLGAGFQQPDSKKNNICLRRPPPPSAAGMVLLYRGSALLLSKLNLFSTPMLQAVVCAQQ